MRIVLEELILLLDAFIVTKGVNKVKLTCKHSKRMKMAKMVSRLDGENDAALLSISSGDKLPSSVLSPLSHSSKREMQKLK